MMRLVPASLGFCFALFGLPLVRYEPLPPEQARVLRYIVTTSPIDVGISSKVCLAIDPTDRQGVWWWEPGRSGCSSRSTGPGVFHANDAVVARRQSETVDVRFRLGLHVAPDSARPPFIDVRLVLHDDGMLEAASGARVPTERRDNLKIPGLPTTGL